MTIQTMRAGGTQHPEEIMNFLTSRIVKGTGGVYNKVSGGLNVSQSGTPAMGVDVAEGFAFIRKDGDDMCYPVRLYDGSETVPISSNSSGFDRIDAIVLYNNLGATANADITNVSTLIVVEGTPSASPISPDTTAIEASIGSSNPYTVLAHVTVSNGETAIVDADISDEREEVVFEMKFESMGGWEKILFNTPTLSSTTTTGGITSTISFAGSDMTDVIFKGVKVKIESGAGTTYHYCVESTFSTDTTIKLLGEVNISGLITSIEFSYADTPKSFPLWMDWSETYSTNGAMTYTPTLYSNAKFRVVGEFIEFSVGTLGSTAGTGAGTIYVTAPYGTPGTEYRGGGGISVSIGIGGHWFCVGDGNIAFRRYDSTSFIISTNTVGVYGVGKYKY